MADEIKPVEAPKPVEPEAKAKVEAPKDETKEERMKRLNVSDVPYMTYETEQIQKQREKK